MIWNLLTMLNNNSNNNNNKERNSELVYILLSTNTCSSFPQSEGVSALLIENETNPNKLTVRFHSSLTQNNSLRTTHLTNHIITRLLVHFKQLYWHTHTHTHLFPTVQQTYKHITHIQTHITHLKTHLPQHTNPKQTHTHTPTLLPLQAFHSSLNIRTHCFAWHSSWEWRSSCRILWRPWGHVCPWPAATWPTERTHTLPLNEDWTQVPLTLTRLRKYKRDKMENQY